MRNFGERFLHQQNPTLYTSKSVSSEHARKIKSGEYRPEKKVEPSDQIHDFLEIIKRTHVGHRDNPRVLERIKESYAKTNHFNGDQTASFNKWFDYLTSPASDVFPMWVKYWSFTGMMKLGIYDKNTHEFGKRSQGTDAPFPELNSEALAYVVDAITHTAEKKSVKKRSSDPAFQQLLKETNFGKLYARAIENYAPLGEKERAETAGEWAKFPQGSDPTALAESLYGHNTGWCTAGVETAQRQLERGDFFVYYTNNASGEPANPRLAIRIKDDFIEEVRGIDHNQHIDPTMLYSGILEKKLSEFGQKGLKFQNITRNAQRFEKMWEKYEQHKELDAEDLLLLYEINEQLELFSEDTDPRISILQQSRKDPKHDISIATGLPENEIAFESDYIATLDNPSTIYCGILTLKNYPPGKITCPKQMIGYLDASNVEALERTTFPEKMSGYIDLSTIESCTAAITLPKEFARSINAEHLKNASHLIFPDIVTGSIRLEALETIDGLALPLQVIGEVLLENLPKEDIETLHEMYPHINFVVL